MKRSPPFLLPKNFPPHAPLPPGGPWIRPSNEEDWDEVTVAIRPPPESTARARRTAPGGFAQQPADSGPRATSAAHVRLGGYLAPSLTPLYLVEAGRGKRTG